LGSSAAALLSNGNGPSVARVGQENYLLRQPRDWFEAYFYLQLAEQLNCSKITVATWSRTSGLRATTIWWPRATSGASSSTSWRNARGPGKRVNPASRATAFPPRCAATVAPQSSPQTIAPPPRSSSARSETPYDSRLGGTKMLPSSARNQYFEMFKLSDFVSETEAGGKLVAGKLRSQVGRFGR